VGRRLRPSPRAPSRDQPHGVGDQIGRADEDKKAAEERDREAYKEGAVGPALCPNRQRAPRPKRVRALPTCLKRPLCSPRDHGMALVQTARSPAPPADRRRLAWCWRRAATWWGGAGTTFLQALFRPRTLFSPPGTSSVQLPARSDALDGPDLLALRSAGRTGHCRLLNRPTITWPQSPAYPPRTPRARILDLPSTFGRPP